MGHCDMMISPKKMKSIIDSHMNRMLKDKDFSAAQVPFILEIGRNEGISMKDLCISLGADKGLVTRVVRNLIDSELVENRSETVRTYRLFLTEKGREAFADSTSTLDEAFDQVFSCLDEKDKVDMARIFAKINKKLDELYKY
ncbi:MAG: transcriptional repressor MprA [Methanomassiliicoccales archaeon PtaU1.Bin124]|nr:MAG: transcriptional repressor MprA [Methanomassiliicoccales archaeon PtaU1.Bin124]